jgi:L-fuconolactonase
VRRIDAHHHLWAPERGDYGWMPRDEPRLWRRYGPADLAPILADHGIDATVLVQAAPTVAETDYMLGLADATDWIAGVVGWVDFENRDHVRHLERFARHPKFVGVRPMIVDIPDAGWMLREDIRWGYRALVDLDLSFDALGFPMHLANFARVAEAHPDLRMVIDHCLKPRIRDHPEGFDAWAEGIARLAATQAFCKLSGLVNEAAAGWTVNDLRPYADHVLAAFGPHRVLWGSDWPVCRLAAEYGDWLAGAEALTSALDDEARAAIFGGTAARAYRLPRVGPGPEHGDACP